MSSGIDFDGLRGNIKTIAGYDFSFQPSLDRNRILALAQLEFIDRRQQTPVGATRHKKIASRSRSRLIRSRPGQQGCCCATYSAKEWVIEATTTLTRDIWLVV